MTSGSGPFTPSCFPPRPSQEASGMPGAHWRPIDGARGIGARNPLKVQEARDQRRRDKSGAVSVSASPVDHFAFNRIPGVEPKGFGTRGPRGPAFAPVTRNVATLFILFCAPARHAPRAPPGWPSALRPECPAGILRHVRVCKIKSRAVGTHGRPRVQQLVSLTPIRYLDKLLSSDAHSGGRTG